MECIQNEIEEIEADKTRPAFLQYLNDAPQPQEGETVQDFANNPTKCGDLREYFEYDRDYPDDDRICEEVKDLKVSSLLWSLILHDSHLLIIITSLQCLTDFSNLDGLVTGVPGAIGNVNADVQLAISNIIQAPIDTAAGAGESFIVAVINLFVLETFSHCSSSLDAVDPCSKDQNKLLRSLIFGYRKAVQIANRFLKQVEYAGKICESIPSIPFPVCSDAPEKLCKLLPTLLQITIGVLLFAIEILVDIYERVYDELCVKATKYDTLRQDAIYDNVITIARNGITVSFVLLYIKM